MNREYVEKAKGEVAELKAEIARSVSRAAYQTQEREAQDLRKERDALRARLKDSDDDWKRIQDAERERDALMAEVERLTSAFQVTTVELVTVTESRDALRTEVENGNILIADAKAEVNKLKTVLDKPELMIENYALRAEVERLRKYIGDCEYEHAPAERAAWKEQAMKLGEALERIRWSWANDAGRACDEIADNALMLFDKWRGKR